MRRTSLYTLIAILVIIGGYFALEKYLENKLVKEAQREAEVFLLQNFDDIEKVTVYEDGYKFYPAGLGGLSISGYVNGNKELFFNINFSISDYQLGRVTSIVNPDEFPSEKEK